MQIRVLSLLALLPVVLSLAIPAQDAASSSTLAWARDEPRPSELDAQIALLRRVLLARGKGKSHKSGEGAKSHNSGEGGSSGLGTSEGNRQLSKAADKVTEHSTKGMALLKQYEGQPMPPHVAKQVDYHTKQTTKELKKMGVDPAGSSAASGSGHTSTGHDYVGKVTKIPNDGPPYRNGIPHSGGKAGED